MFFLGFVFGGIVLARDGRWCQREFGMWGRGAAKVERMKRDAANGNALKGSSLRFVVAVGALALLQQL